MKKGISICLTVALLGCAIIWLLFTATRIVRFSEGEVNARFRALDKKIQIMEDGSWKDFEVIGVNIGTGYPGVFPNENGIDEDTYYRWFEKIAEMNVNTLRVYKIQSPAFYSALFRYNENHTDTLYLIQGADFRDQIMYSEKNILDSAVKQTIFEETYDLIDALHGNQMILDTKTGEMNCYIYDVSEYVLGYILGVEWDEVFVDYICQINVPVARYTGEYLYCDENANAFEVFLAEWGDTVFDFEQRRYHRQCMVSFCNWPNTDPLLNEFELIQNGNSDTVPDTEATIDLEHIHLMEKVKTGLFASYNVYPYFPYFLQYGEYTEYMDETGNRNPYRRYLMELTDHHTYPVIISEYGVPASRSETYGDIWYNIGHGGLTEEEQGHALLRMYQDIQKAQCAGSIVFTWQDEWYKTTWNEKMMSDPDGRAYWSNAQCAEQFFGLLAFEPSSGTTCYPDGDLSDWSERDLVADAGDIRLRMQSDEKYLYFQVTGLDQRSQNNRINIALDVTPKSGASIRNGTSFERPVDFLIQIDSSLSGAVLVQEYYDTLLFSALGGYHDMSTYTASKLLEKQQYEHCSADGSVFHVISRASGDINSALAADWIKDETGFLKHGNANPNSQDYDSNADYCISGDTVEIRIPWQLLNFYDPSKCLIIDDFRANNYQIKGLEIDRIYAAAYYDDQTEVTQFGAYELKSWDTPQFHERLKQSYYILQEAFGRENPS